MAYTTCFLLIVCVAFAGVDAQEKTVDIPDNVEAVFASIPELIQIFWELTSELTMDDAKLAKQIETTRNDLSELMLKWVTNDADDILTKWQELSHANPTYPAALKVLVNQTCDLFQKWVKVYNDPFHGSLEIIHLMLTKFQLELLALTPQELLDCMTMFRSIISTPVSVMEDAIDAILLKLPEIAEQFIDQIMPTPFDIRALQQMDKAQIAALMNKMKKQQ